MADTTVQDKIIQIIREQLPAGVLKKSDESLKLWIEIAANEINRRRKKTTRKEATITFVEGTSAYALPADCIQVEDLILEGEGLQSAPILSPTQFPLQFQSYGLYGCLPTGQRITRSMDIILRQQVTGDGAEVSWHTEGTQLVIEFTPTAGTTARLLYTAEDLSVESLPRRFYQLVTYYCRKEALQLFLEGAAASPDHIGDALVARNYAEMNKSMETLRRDWNEGLALIQAEVD